MPHHKSAMKRIRQDKKRRVRNRAAKSAVKSAARQVKESSDSKEAAQLLSRASSLLDSAARKRIIHWRRAARKKSRLAKHVKSLSA